MRSVLMVVDVKFADAMTMTMPRRPLSACSRAPSRTGDSRTGRWVRSYGAASEEAAERDVAAVKVLLLLATGGGGWRWELLLVGGASSWYTASEVRLGFSECFSAVKRKGREGKGREGHRARRTSRCSARGEEAAQRSINLGRHPDGAQVLVRVGWQRDSSKETGGATLRGVEEEEHSTESQRDRQFSQCSQLLQMVVPRA